ncbi:IclR family transcriptional regulator [Paraburkholderia oxyphila]|uniref:IclR family transcriptional regulator n=1 Tax=Paraburkholderia oxyphila TaxID=614212 RepID=UPI000480D874|nr:IclR family transcriptional regulator [Paraburkholderia oxyphila]
MKRDADIETDARSGVLAAEVVLQVLGAFVGAEPALKLKTLAERAEMHPAKVHRYLVSLCQQGFVRQDPGTGLYHLAEGALRLGMAAMETFDPASVARPLLQSLREATHLTVVLAFWEMPVPVVAAQEIHSAPLVLATRVGSSLQLLTTATGWTFCAWLPRSTAERAIAHALASSPSYPVPDWASRPERMDGAFAKIRRDGVASSSGQMNLQVHGLSAPVFDGSGSIAAVVSVLGLSGEVDLDLNGETALALKNYANQISLEFGWHPDLAHTEAGG